MKIFKNFLDQSKEELQSLQVLSGMGEATAKVFASEGVKVIATDVNQEEIQSFIVANNKRRMYALSFRCNR